jgi:5'-nucleotidase
MRVLICNDDGIYSKGIRTLAERLATEFEVTVVAPDRPKSAVGHGITLHKPLYIDRHDWGSAMDVFAVNGTPADCVKVGVQLILADKRPDLIISGINEGANLGTDIIYSGTVSAAVEGIIQGIPSLAVSLCGDQFTDFTYSADFTASLARLVMEKGLDTDTLLNVNIPSPKREEITGVAITSVGKRRYDSSYEARLDPRGRSYYWIAGKLMDIQNSEDSDVHAISQNRISISPVRFVLTHQTFMDTLKQWKIKW